MIIINNLFSIELLRYTELIYRIENWRLKETVGLPLKASSVNQRIRSIKAPVMKEHECCTLSVLQFPKLLCSLFELIVCKLLCVTILWKYMNHNLWSITYERITESIWYGSYRLGYTVTYHNVRKVFKLLAQMIWFISYDSYHINHNILFIWMNCILIGKRWKFLRLSFSESIN